MESQVGKKRKLDHDAESAPEPVSLQAQHKALSINLYRYKRKITILEQQLSTARSRYAGADDVISALGRRISQVRATAQTRTAHPSLHRPLIIFHFRTLQMQDDLRSTVALLPSAGINLESLVTASSSASTDGECLSLQRLARTTPLTAHPFLLRCVSPVCLLQTPRLWRCCAGWWRLQRRTMRHPSPRWRQH